MTLMFLDDAGPAKLQRFDVVKYPIFIKLVDQHNSFFWRPQEIDCSKDGLDFKKLPPEAQYIFTENISGQIVLDTTQGRSPLIALGPCCSLPEVEAFLTTWTFYENIHSRSYTHVLQSVYPNPTEVFDKIKTNTKLMKYQQNIEYYYHQLELHNAHRLISGQPATYEHKKALWMCVNSINALEGIRFYTSFAISWTFAETQKMEGNAKIIKMIARDENIHLAATQNMLKILPNDDPDYKKIKGETEHLVYNMFMDVVEQEFDRIDTLFRYGSIIGLNAAIAKEYIRFISQKRMSHLGMNAPFKVTSNPLPWTQKWIGGAEVQVAPQEVSATNYIHGTKKDINETTFAGFEL